MSQMRVGFDLQRVDVVTDSIRRFGARYLDRVYTTAEQEAAAAGDSRDGRLAARFAAKEAVIKMLDYGDRPLEWHDIEVRSLPSGAPELVLSGTAAELAAAAGLQSISVSLSHDARYAVASVIALTA